METKELVQHGLRVPSSPQTNPEKKFFPSGAIAFFVLLILLGMIIWFGIYFLMLERV